MERCTSVQQMVARCQAHSEQSRNNSATASSEDYCPLCNNDGYIVVDRANWIVKPCSCLELRKDRERIKASGLEEQLKTMTFDTYKADDPWKQKAKQTAEAWVQHVLDGGSSWLFFGGQPGSGKTHLCTAACGKLLNARKRVRYMLWTEDSRRLKASIMEMEEFDRLSYPLIATDVLYIDDLFKTQRGRDADGKITTAEVRTAFELLDARYRMKRPTIISTEWMMDELIATDEATYSRVYEMCKGFRVQIKRDPTRNYRLKDSGDAI